ncbi:MAG: IPT/TIG domain-containing protein, partial [Balneolaceae bacterium]
MKSNFTRIAGLFVLAFSIALAGCKDHSTGPNNGGNGGNGGPPSISSFSPDAGPAGTEVTIKGENFSSTASENTVIFGGNNEATVNSASASELKVTVPDGATTGKIKVTVGTESVESGAKFAVAPQIYADLPGNKTLITEDETWANDTTIAGPHYVLPGVTLTVKEGVTVKFKYHNQDANQVGTIITMPGTWDNFSDGFRPSGRLVAKGTATNPIIFTSAKGTPEVGDWGGIILAGNAVNSWPGGQGEIEGLSQGV